VLGVGHVVQPLGEERGDVAVVAGGAGEDLGVAEPAEPLVTLRAVGGDAFWSHGVRRYWKSHYLWDLPDAAIDAFLGRGTASAGGGAPVTGSLQTRGGAIARIGEQDTAAGHRAAGFEFMAATSWTDPGEDDTRRTSTRLYADQIAPFGRGVNVNNLGIEGEDRVRDAYGAQEFERLTYLKARFDPDNVFHLNQNICPAPTSAGQSH
jgi:hypothetical protein